MNTGPLRPSAVAGHRAVAAGATGTGPLEERARHHFPSKDGHARQTGAASGGHVPPQVRSLRRHDPDQVRWVDLRLSATGAPQRMTPGYRDLPGASIRSQVRPSDRSAAYRHCPSRGLRTQPQALYTVSKVTIGGLDGPKSEPVRVRKGDCPPARVRRPVGAALRRETEGTGGQGVLITFDK